jgi:hypothetical protein
MGLVFKSNYPPPTRAALATHLIIKLNMGFTAKYIEQSSALTKLSLLAEGGGATQACDVIIIFETMWRAPKSYK